MQKRRRRRRWLSKFRWTLGKDLKEEAAAAEGVVVVEAAEGLLQLLLLTSLLIGIRRPRRRRSRGAVDVDVAVARAPARAKAVRAVLTTAVREEAMHHRILMHQMWQWQLLAVNPVVTQMLPAPAQLLKAAAVAAAAALPIEHRRTPDRLGHHNLLDAIMVNATCHGLKAWRVSVRTP